MSLFPPDSGTGADAAPSVLRDGGGYWGWMHRPLGRVRFLGWAMALFALKVVCDRLLLGWLGEAAPPLSAYFLQSAPWPGGVDVRVEGGVWALGILLVASIPFLGIGCVLCLRRLRTAGLPPVLVVLFVVPVLKWFLFVLLFLVRGPTGVGGEPGRAATGGRWRWIPDSSWGSALVAIALSGGLGLAAAVAGTEGLASYGWAVFAGIPFVMGFIAVLLHTARSRRSVAECVGVASLSAALVGLGFLVFAYEGLICLIMAAPLAWALAVVGGLLAYLVQGSPAVVQTRNGRWELGCWTPLLAVPLMVGTEEMRQGPPPLLRVTTSVDIAASPDRVWRHVVTFSELPPPTEAIFRLGIAYPLRAEIRGTGVGAVRHCVFSTGPFVEPIEVWDEPRLLAFGVTENPAPMEEWTPYRDVHPPHLDGFLVSRRGQFRLEPIPGGGTRLEGTTWYHHSLWPAAYWQVWSDAIIHTIHRRVLGHVRGLAEGEAGADPGRAGGSVEGGVSGGVMSGVGSPDLH